MLEKLYEYKAQFEKELLLAEAQVAVINKIIEAEERNIQNNAERLNYEAEVAEQPNNNVCY